MYLIPSKHLKTFLFIVSSIALAACSESVKYDADADKNGHTTPTTATMAANQQLADTLPLTNTQDFEDARRGLIAQDPNLIIANHENREVWSLPAFSFIPNAATPETAAEAANAAKASTPASVNPSLWRQASLNSIHGLFKVTEGIYQLRGFDLANMTIIEGNTGWIIVDPLTSAETAKQALAFAQQHLPPKPIRALLFTHSHIDHFGGAQGIIDTLTESEKAALRIIAPVGFMEEATSENIIAGTAMSRRAMFMYGKNLQRSERGHIDSGLGKGPSFGSFGLAAPTELVHETPTELNIDGVPFVFQYTPGSEAPAEFTFYLPDHKAFCGAEVVSRNMHNLYTLRGAKVRDALGWSRFIDEAITLFADSEVYFGTHHWPMWGQDRIRTFLSKQRDTYKYIHDQSVRLMNQGFTPNEIAEQLELPESLRTEFSNRGYYGTIKHNAKAVYQAYMGWFTGNPAALDPLPETEAATRYVELMGGAEAVLKKAEQLFENASTAPANAVNKEYRWIAQILNHVIFANPSNAKAKALLAKTYDQLAYQSESAPWRDFYLMGAYELRTGPPAQGLNIRTMKGVVSHAPVENFFDSMAVTLNGPKAEGKRLNVVLNFTDLKQTYLLTLENSVLRNKTYSGNVKPDATLNLTHSLFLDILLGNAGLKETLFSDDLSIEGSKLDLVDFFSLFDKPDGKFNIVTP